jgi:hypothetical protein
MARPCISEVNGRVLEIVLELNQFNLFPTNPPIYAQSQVVSDVLLTRYGVQSLINLGISNPKMIPALQYLVETNNLV